MTAIKKEKAEQESEYIFHYESNIYLFFLFSEGNRLINF